MTNSVQQDADLGRTSERLEWVCRMLADLADMAREDHDRQIRMEAQLNKVCSLGQTRDRRLDALERDVNELNGDVRNLYRSRWTSRIGALGAALIGISAWIKELLAP